MKQYRPLIIGLVLFIAGFFWIWNWFVENRELSSPTPPAPTAELSVLETPAEECFTFLRCNTWMVEKGRSLSGSSYQSLKSWLRPGEVLVVHLDNGVEKSAQTVSSEDDFADIERIRHSAAVVWSHYYAIPKVWLAVPKEKLFALDQAFSYWHNALDCEGDPESYVHEMDAILDDAGLTRADLGLKKARIQQLLDEGCHPPNFEPFPGDSQ